MRIYLVTDEGLLLGKDLYRTVEAAVKGGVSMVQLREKESSTREFIERAIRLKEVLTPYGVPLIINDRVDVALAADADGVHVGQSDMPYEMVKRLLPEGKIIGLSVESPEQVLELNGYRITAFRVNHNVICYGYTLEILRKGKFSPERAREQGIPLKFWNPLQKGQTIEENGMIYTPDMVLGPERKGIKVTYTTDTRPTESILRNAKASDLFICEGRYGEEDKIEKAKGYKHMTFREAATLARDAEVSEMWLTHYSPSLIRPDEYMDMVRGIFPNAWPGKDGKTMELNFEED